MGIRSFVQGKKRADKTAAVKEQATKVGEQATKVGKALDPSDFRGPSPNVATNLAIADIAMRSGAVIARQAVERAMLGGRYSGRKAKKIVNGRSLGETLVHGALARVALRSVPGAIIVGGGLIAKTLYDRSRAHRARAEGEAQMHKQALDGEDA